MLRVELPLCVAAGVVEQVLADERPRAIGILGHEDVQRALAGTDHEAGRESEPLALALVLGDESVGSQLREERHVEPGRSPRRGASTRRRNRSADAAAMNGVGRTYTVRPSCSNGSPVHAWRIDAIDVSMVRARSREAPPE